MCILIKKYNIYTRVLSQNIIGTSSGAYESNHECVFSFVKFAREVKVTTIFYCSIKYGSFPSVCISEKHVSVVVFCMRILGTVVPLIIMIHCMSETSHKL